LLKERGEDLSSSRTKKPPALTTMEDHDYPVDEGSELYELSNEELISIVENHWNYTESFMEDVEEELNKRKIKPNTKDIKVNIEEVAQDTRRPQNSNNEGFAGFLDFLGYITIIIGVIATVMLFINYSQPSLFSNGNISGTQIMIAFGVGFYHLVFGTLCLGIAKTLRQ